MPPSLSDRPVPVVPGYALRWAGRFLIIRPECWSNPGEGELAASIVTTLRALRPPGVIVDVEGILAPGADWSGQLERLAREVGPIRPIVVGQKGLLEALRAGPARDLVDLLPTEAEALQRLTEARPAELPDIDTVKFSGESLEATHIGSPSASTSAESINLRSSTELFPSLPPRPGVDRLPKLPNYEILSEIARGGMGVVYKARQLGVNRLVALKMTLAGQFAGDDERRRFMAEAEAAGQLDHPHIVPVYEVGEQGGQPYFSMGFVEGTTLRTLLSEGPLPPLRAAELIRKIAEAVHYAHGRGIVHRDLKPANVLIDLQGEPRVTDFGLAKLSTGDSHLTSTGQILGTPSFMPPEQAQGRIADVGPLSDVYSLGATLYALLTGRPPFQSPSALETVMQVVQQEPVPPRQLTAGVPAALETICLKCLQKDPARRYSSARELAEDLGRFLRNEPIRARPVGALTRGALWCRRNPGVAALSGTAVLLLVLAAAISTVAYVREARLAADKTRLANEKSQLADKESAARKSADAAAKRAEAANRLAAQRLLRLQVSTGNRASEEARVGEALLWYQAARENESVPAEDAMHRFRLGHALTSLKLDLAGIGFHNEEVGDARFLPDGRRVLTRAADGSYRVWNLEESRVLGKVMTHRQQGSLHGLPRRSDHMEIRPQGDVLATSCRDGRVRLWDLGSCEVKRSWTLPGGSVHGLTFHPEGRILVACDHRGGLHVFDVETGEEQPSPITSKHRLRAPVFHPSGRQLAVMNEGGGTEVWSWPTGEQNGYRALAQIPTGPDATLRYVPTFAPRSGRLLLREMNERGGTSWSLVSEDGRRLAMGPLPSHFDRGLHYFAINPEGTRFIVSIGLTSRVYDDTGKEQLVLDHPTLARHAAFTPDGRWILTASNGPHLWDAATGASAGELPRSAQAVLSLAMHPSGSSFLTTSVDGTARLWRLNLTPHVLHPWTDSSPEALPRDPRFSADGRRTVRLDSDSHGISVVDVQSKKSLLGPLVKPHPAKRIHGFPKDHEKIAFPCLNAAGTLLAFSIPTSGTLAVWEIETKRCRFARAELFVGTTAGLSFSSDDRVLFHLCGGRARIWDASTGLPLGPEVPVGTAHCSLAADGRRIIVARVQKGLFEEIEIIDGRTGNLLNHIPLVGQRPPMGAVGVPQSWATARGVGLGYRSGTVGGDAPRRTVAAWEVHIPEPTFTAAQSQRVVRLMTGQFIDSTDGVSLLLPTEFTRNPEAYREAWLAWRKSQFPPPAEPSKP